MSSRAQKSESEQGVEDGADRSNLEWHGKQWRAVVAIPRAARPTFGKHHLKVSLQTGNLAVANKLKPAILARLRREIAEALGKGTPELVITEARAIRLAQSLIPYAQRRHAEVSAQYGEAVGALVSATALGHATAIGEHVERFLGDSGYQPKSEADARRTLGRLAAHLEGLTLPPIIEAIDRAAAKSFLRGLMHDRGLTRKNAAKHLSFIRSFWRWLEEEGITDGRASPWDRITIPKASSAGRHSVQEPDEGKRPYTDKELTALLQGTPPKQTSYLPTLIRLGALSGMRLEELYRLRIRDVQGGFFSLGAGKTKSAQRRVPVHPDAAPIVAILMAGKAPDAYLIDPEAKVVALTGIRSSAASKSFTRFRRALSIDERPNDKAKSNVDFHSLRRWFIKQAKDALDAGAKGYTAWTIADVVGHDDDGMKDILRLTMSHYPGPSGDAARIACVAAVKLPK